jgi:hypothetical protein
MSYRECLERISYLLALVGILTHRRIDPHGLSAYEEKMIERIEAELKDARHALQEPIPF